MAALRFARLTQDQWARQNGVTQGHLSNVLSGERESAKLAAKIDAFADRHLGKHLGHVA